MTAAALPAAYAWLRAEPGPRMLIEGLKLYGVREVAGAGNNPVILGWADEVGDAGASAYARWAAGWYDRDSTPWCGLFMAVIALRANEHGRADRAPPEKYLAASSWSSFGEAVPLTGAMLGDILVFVRNGGGHVGQYVGEDHAAFHVLGGNQGDAVSIARIDKRRCIAVRRVPYLNQPPNVRKVFLAADGALSTDEA